MTTPFDPIGLWPAATVAILANGPDMTPELAKSLSQYPTIAVNRAVRHAPWADMLLAIDGNWPAEGESFAGLRVVGIESDADALYVGIPYEVVDMGPLGELHLRNNLLAALRVAARAGAARIILAGVDVASYEALHSFPGLAEGLAKLVTELAAQGIVVEQIGAASEPEPVAAKGPARV